MAQTILVVDDERRLASLMQSYLENAGFRVVLAHDGREALFAARDEKPDLIVLDVMMPEMDGYEFMRLHRRERNTPIIMLTARADEADRIDGLGRGADDYVTKPFSPKEVVARVEAVLRRLNRLEEPAEAVFRAGDLVLDEAAWSATLAGKTIDLTASEFSLLLIMMRSPGRAFSRLELLDKLQGDLFEGYERTIDVHIKNMRAKIEANPRKPIYIETVYGVGYRMSNEW